MRQIPVDTSAATVMAAKAPQDKVKTVRPARSCTDRRDRRQADDGRRDVQPQR